jgi:hypothetical protein
MYSTSIALIPIIFCLKNTKVSINAADMRMLDAYAGA